MVETEKKRRVPLTGREEKAEGVGKKMGEVGKQGIIVK